MLRLNARDRLTETRLPRVTRMSLFASYFRCGMLPWARHAHAHKRVMWSTCLKPRLFPTMRQHLSADGIRRNKINLLLPREGNGVKGMDGERNTRWKRGQEGRKEGRKGGRKEGRWSGMGKARQNRGYLRLAPISLPRPTPGILIDPTPPYTLWDTGTRVEISAEKDTWYTTRREPFCSFERERTPSREQNDPRKSIIQSAINRARRTSVRLAGHGHF